MPTDANGDNVYEVTVRASDGTLSEDRQHQSHRRQRGRGSGDHGEPCTTGLRISGPISPTYSENGKRCNRHLQGGIGPERGQGQLGRWRAPDADAFTVSAATGASTMLRFRSTPNFERAGGRRH